jgi:serine phosphatase RsbU (regulator of sigma subunit)
MPDPVFVPSTGVLHPGDALLLYTDGLVEVPGRDLAVGIDKLVGAAEFLVTRGFPGGAEQLVDRVVQDASDDRGLVLLWRDR